MLEQIKDYWGYGVALGGALVTLLWGARRNQNDTRRQEAPNKSRREFCEFGEANKERISELKGDLKVVRAEIAEIQRELDEVFSRLRGVEALANQILGHLKEKL